MGEHQNVKLNRTVKAAVLTVSDTRDFDTDKGGQCVRQLLQADDVEEDIDVIITTGGTGIAQRDVTIEAVKPLLTKEIEGFGELFRYLSYVEDVGTRALLSRAVAGTVNNKLIFSIPGSTGAVKLALEKLIKPELNHLIHELTK